MGSLGRGDHGGSQGDPWLTWKICRSALWVPWTRSPPKNAGYWLAGSEGDSPLTWQIFAPRGRGGGAIEKCQTDGSAPSARDAAKSSDSSFSTAAARTPAPSPPPRRA